MSFEYHFQYQLTVIIRDTLTHFFLHRRRNLVCLEITLSNITEIFTVSTLLVHYTLLLLLFLLYFYPSRLPRQQLTSFRLVSTEPATEEDLFCSRDPISAHNCSYF